MAITKQVALIVAMFLIPVVCCFIGIGAFIHVTLAAEKVERQKDTELRRQKLQELAELQRQLKTLQEAARALQQNIDDIMRCRFDNLGLLTGRFRLFGRCIGLARPIKIAQTRYRLIG